MSNVNEAAVELIDRLGGLARVGRLAGVSRQAVSKWRVHGFPPDRWDGLVAAAPKAAPWKRLGRAKGRGRAAAGGRAKG